MSGLASLVVVSYNGGERLRTCLTSLVATTAPDVDILVIDNASSDGSPEELRRLANEHPRLRIRLEDQNLGYAWAVNEVLAECRTPYLGVLNMDLVFEPGWLEPLVRFLEERPEVAAVNPLVLLSGTERVNTCGHDVHLTGLGFTRAFGEPSSRMGPEPVEVSGISGAAFVVRADVLRRLGGIDSTGFLYHEDTNLSWLLRLAGHTLYCVPQARVQHDYALSMSPSKLFLLERNRWTMLLSYLSPAGALLIAPVLLFSEALVWGFCLLKGTSFLVAKTRSYRSVLSRRKAVAERRCLVRRIRALPDWRLFLKLRWGYPVGQFLSIAGEGPEARRDRLAPVPAPPGSSR
jgi:GT2 family glycosyltransferase